MGLGLDIALPGLPSFTLPNVANAFETGFVFELIDSRREKPIDQHVLVLNPRRYTVSEPFQSTLTPTEDNTVIEETNGIIVREINMEGTFGLKKRSPPRFSSSAQADKSGNEQFALLRRLFQTYSKLKQAPNEAPFISLHFHALRENDHWVVVPRAFEMPRDAKLTRMHYDWRITLTAIAPSGAVRLKAVKDDYSFTDALRDINQAINDATAFFNDISVFKQAVRRKIANIDAILISVEGLITQVSLAMASPGFGNSIDYSYERAKEVVDEVKDLADQFATSFDETMKGNDAVAERAMRKLEAALGTTLAYPEQFKEVSRDRKRRIERMFLGERALSEDDLSDETGGATENSALRVQRGTEQDAGIDYGTSENLVRIRVDATTTLESLASRYAVATELIVLVNDLKPPYFSRGGFEGTRKPGDYILMPQAASTSGSSFGVTNTPRKATGAGIADSDPAIALYGSDLALDPDELALGRLDIKEDLTHDADDAEIVEGIPNVVQALNIVTHTRKGETQFLPDIGLVDVVGSRALLANVVLSAITLQNALLEDDRIEDIDAASVTLDEDVLSHTVVPRLRGSQEGIEVVLPFGRVAGG